MTTSREETDTDEIIGTVQISPGGLGHSETIVRVRQDGPWVILYVKDGAGAQTTVSLTPRKAFDIAELLRGSGITAGVKG